MNLFFFFDHLPGIWLGPSVKYDWFMCSIYVTNRLFSKWLGLTNCAPTCELTSVNIPENIYTVRWGGRPTDHIWSKDGKAPSTPSRRAHALSFRYSPCHNYLPFSIAHVHWKTARNYETGCMRVAFFYYTYFKMF